MFFFTSFVKHYSYFNYSFSINLVIEYLLFLNFNKRNYEILSKNGYKSCSNIINICFKTIFLIIRYNIFDLIDFCLKVEFFFII